MPVSEVKVEQQLDDLQVHSSEVHSEAIPGGVVRRVTKQTRGKVLISESTVRLSGYSTGSTTRQGGFLMRFFRKVQARRRTLSG